MLKKKSLFYLSAITLGMSTHLGILALSANSQTITPSRYTVPTQSPNAPANLSNDDYILGPGDTIKFTMYGQTELFDDNGYLVAADGTIGLPYIGRIAVKGLSVKQVVETVKQKYGKDFFKRPLVTATITNHRPANISISGEILRPGLYPLAPEASTNTTLTQVIKLAGGTTQAADISNVQIKRLVAGSPQLVRVDLTKLLVNSAINQDLVLRDGDAIFVPAVKAYDPAKSNLIAKANFSVANDEPLKISVVGEVYRPGAYLVTPANPPTTTAGQPGTATTGTTSATSSKPSITQAIQLAGGIKPEADVRKIEVRRETAAGEKYIINIDLWKLLDAGDLSQDIPLQRGDVVFIPTADQISREEAAKIATASFSPSAINVSVVGEVKAPGVVQLPPNSPLSSALGAVGGFDAKRAKRKEVELIRINPDGSVTQRIVAVDFSQGINDKSNPSLRNNDVIVVNRSGLAQFSDSLSGILSPLPFLGLVNTLFF